MPHWKDIQSRHRLKKQTKLALMVLVLVAGLLVASWGSHFTKSLFSPFKLSVHSNRSYIWNGKFNINLLIRTNSVSLLSYSPREGRVVIISIPDETFLEVPSGLGLWQLRAVSGLGQAQKGMEGNKLLVDTLASFFAVPIDGFLDLSGLKSQKTAAEVVDTLRKNPFSGFSLLAPLKTNLTPWELVKLKVGMLSVRFDKVKQLDLVKLNVLDKATLPDGTPILTADPVKLDSVLDDLADPAIIAEHKTIAVLNATDRPQLALKWARMITNLGGNVIITANAGQRLKKVAIGGEESLTLTRLRQIFGLSDKISQSDGDLVPSRAQINLLLGDDL